MSISNLLSASLLLAALAVPSASAFAQSAPAQGAAGNQSQSQELVQPETPAQNWFDWRIEPHSRTNLLDGLQADQFKPPLKFQVPHNNRAATDDDSTAVRSCLSMRSYVVARDEPNSDSVHLVKYSTCQPTERYQVKSADVRVLPIQR
jgi:hypothetical protein